jgi:hypothetical protein
LPAAAGQKEKGRRKPLSGGVAFSTRDLPNEQPLRRAAKSHHHLNLLKFTAGDGKYKQPEKSNAGSFSLNLKIRNFILFRA